MVICFLQCLRQCFFDYPNVLLLHETACISKVGTVLMASRLQAFSHRTTCGLLQHWKKKKRERKQRRGYQARWGWDIGCGMGV